MASMLPFLRRVGNTLAIMVFGESIPGILLTVSPDNLYAWMAIDPRELAPRGGLEDGFVTMTEMEVAGLPLCRTLVVDTSDAGRIVIRDAFRLNAVASLVVPDLMPSGWLEKAQAKGEVGVYVGDVGRLILALEADPSLRNDADRVARLSVL